MLFPISQNRVPDLCCSGLALTAESPGFSLPVVRDLAFAWSLLMLCLEWAAHRMSSRAGTSYFYFQRRPIKLINGKNNFQTSFFPVTNGAGIWLIISFPSKKNE